ncbi:MAG: ChaN family lipoprotein [Microscillaceae bacterium]|nr:ChaN family lipoprotein [Microscillaceae bacterium]
MPKPAYQLFDAQGQALTYEALRQSAQKAEIILFGELHNNPICHWLQFELFQDLFATFGPRLKLGAEMFEADNQLILNEYLAGLISEKHLHDEAKLWDNYDTDYRPLVEFAKTQALPVIATNIPRRYAALVSKQGPEALQKLSPEARQWMMPLPLQADLSRPAYANMMKMMSGHGGGMGAMKPENFAYAQAVKDATMAYFILKNLEKGEVMFHCNGSYHSDNYDSIVWFLLKEAPKKSVLTIATVEQEQLLRLEEENLRRADFVLVIPKNMTKTY